ncbi:hypothetical protein V6N12_060423 [Hibiscus sabdariffa]|uniref:S-locus receptor kinase C-terminal domain-containing protein n=1 Tax=Hibiscus sabdariffa TaxID=183260 RepID=A0ABR2D4F0_9ROSI
MGDMCHSMTRVALPVVPGAAKVCRQQEQSVRTELVGQDGVQQHAGDLLDVSATRASENLSPVSVHGEFGTTQLEQVDQESSDNCGSIPTVAAENVPLERVTQEVTQHMNQVPQDDAQESMTDQESDRLVNENVPEDDTTQVEEVVSAQEGTCVDKVVAFADADWGGCHDDRSENASVPAPKQPAFVVRRCPSSKASSSSKPETFSQNELTVTLEHGR